LLHELEATLTPNILGLYICSVFNFSFFIYRSRV